MPEEPQQDPVTPPVDPQPSTPNPWETPRPVAPAEPIAVDDSAAPIATPTSPLTAEPATVPEDISASIASEIEDTSSVAPSQPAPVIASSPKKSKKPLIITLIIVLVLAVLGGASALAYTLYENPQKVITDAFINMVNAKSIAYDGTFTVKSSEFTGAITITGQQATVAGSLNVKLALTAGGKTYNLTGDGLMNDKGDLFVKFSDLGDITTLAKSSLGTSSDKTVDALSKEIDGSWIKIASSDLKSYSDEVATGEGCITSTLDKFQSDSSAMKEISDLYSKHQFIVVDKELGIKDGTIGYQLKEDDAAATAFTDGFKSTKIYTSLVACDSSLAIDSSAVDSTPSTSTGSLQVWVGQWSHQLAKTTFTTASNGTTADGTINTMFGKPVTVTTPTSSIALSDLEKDITNILESTVSE